MFYTVVGGWTTGLRELFIFKLQNHRVTCFQRSIEGCCGIFVVVFWLFDSLRFFWSCKLTCILEVPLLMSWWKSSNEANNSVLVSELWYEAKGVSEYPNFWKKKPTKLQKNPPKPQRVRCSFLNKLRNNKAKVLSCLYHQRKGLENCPDGSCTNTVSHFTFHSTTLIMHLLPTFSLNLIFNHYSKYFVQAL